MKSKGTQNHLKISLLICRNSMERLKMIKLSRKSDEKKGKNKKDEKKRL
jgi:hypothetical protein